MAKTVAGEGVKAVGTLSDLLTPGKQFDTAMLDPGYQFGLTEGNRSIENGGDICSVLVDCVAATDTGCLFIAERPVDARQQDKRHDHECIFAMTAHESV